jgi:hypothetical protein
MNKLICENETSLERISLAAKTEGELADMLTELCLDPAFGEDTLMWAFQPYKIKDGKATGFFRVWCISEALSSESLIYNDHDRTLHHHLLDAIIRVRVIREDLLSWI